MNKAIKIVCVKPTLVLFLIQYKHVRNDISHSTVENWSEIRSTINNISIKIGQSGCGSTKHRETPRKEYTFRVARFNFLFHIDPTSFFFFYSFRAKESFINLSDDTAETSTRVSSTASPRQISDGRLDCDRLHGSATVRAHSVCNVAALDYPSPFRIYLFFYYWLGAD